MNWIYTHHDLPQYFKIEPLHGSNIFGQTSGEGAILIEREGRAIQIADCNRLAQIIEKGLLSEISADEFMRHLRIAEHNIHSHIMGYELWASAI